MSKPLDQHQIEIHANQRAWNSKPLLQTIYAGFYDKIARQVVPAIPGRIVEIGSGIGNLKSRFPTALATDLFPNPWLDLVCDGYELPFPSGTVSHLILFDVFHHLEAPRAFFQEAARVLSPRGRVIILDPFISFFSWPAYGVFHHEPVAWRAPINLAEKFPRPRAYYAAQGNATRLFFRQSAGEWLRDWKPLHTESFASFSYLLSGGFSKPAMYPAGLLPMLMKCDSALSALPSLFAARCLVTLEHKS